MFKHNSRILLLPLLLLTAFLLSVSASPLSYAQTDGNGTAASPYSVSQAIQKQDGTAKTVSGYVVGQPTSSNTVLTGSYPSDYALALADSPTETKTASMIYVQIPSTYRSTFGLLTNPDLKGEKITVTGTLSAYFSHAGIKSVSSMAKNAGDSDSRYASYYQSAEGKTGTTLKRALHDIIDDHTELSYANVWDALRQTDEDPANPNHVILLYTGRSQAKTANGSGADDWNREHVWAKSHGDFGTSMGPGTDLHHLRPTDASVNSTRSNLDFDIGGKEHSEARGNYYDADSWEPRDGVKGDVARMLFYMAVRYEGDNGEVDLELNNQVNNGSNPYFGKLNVLLQWNEQDPVDDFERNRNEVIYQDYQHNRNPFIDHPEWASAIWE